MLGREDAHPCGVATRIGQRTHQAGTHHIIGKSEYRDCSRCLLRRLDARVPTAVDDVYLGFRQLGRMLGKLLSPDSVAILVGGDVMALDESETPKSIATCHV